MRRIHGILIDSVVSMAIMNAANTTQSTASWSTILQMTTKKT